MKLTSYQVRLTLTEPLLGTVPMNSKVYLDYIIAKATAKGIPVNVAAELVTVEDLEEKGWTGFHMSEGKPLLLDYQVKGFLKEAANVLKDELKVKTMRSKLDDHLFIFPRHIFIQGTLAEEPFERPLRAMTMQGPRVSLVRSDMIEAGGIIECELRLLPHRELNEEVLHELLSYGALKGLGQFRNGSFGRFTYELKQGPEVDMRVTLAGAST